MKRIVVVVLVVLLGLGLVQPRSGAATTYYPKSKSDRPPIGHVGGQTRDSANPDAANTYTRRDFPAAPAGFRYDRVDAQLATWNTSDAVGFFYANSFYFANGHDYGGYIGLQTEMLNCLPGCVNKHHGAVASIWGATAVNLVPGTPSIAVSDVEVGVAFKSIHYEYNWLPGHVYRTALIRDETLRCLGCNTWVAYIVDDSTGVLTRMGSFTVPDSWDRLLPTSTEFSEEYDPSLYAGCVIPLSRTDFTQSHYMMAFNPTTAANTAPVFSSAVSNSIQANTGCTNSAVNANGGGSFRHLIGATTG